MVLSHQVSLHLGVVCPLNADKVRQTSIRSGKLLSMGKSFVCSGSVLGQDLGEVITKACQRRVGLRSTPLPTSILTDNLSEAQHPSRRHCERLVRRTPFPRLHSQRHSHIPNLRHWNERRHLPVNQSLYDPEIRLNPHYPSHPRPR